MQMQTVYRSHRYQTGFTLIELMVTVMILAILVAIAVPNYRQYVVRNAEREAQAKMLDLQIQLEQWRAKSLTYRGFKPKKVTTDGTVSYEYDETGNKTIYVPSGSTSTDYRYKITLVDGAFDTTTNGEEETTSDRSLIATESDDVSTAVGRNWKMLAQPNSSGITSSAHTFMMTSQGLRCQSKDASITITSANCGTGQQTW